MAALPSPTQVAGNHSAIYEAYYNVVDPNGFGTVGGMDAARFLKRSGLSDVILSKIWDLSDPGGRGCLDKSGMFVAMKLVALVQNGKDLNLSHIQDQDVPPPKMGDVPLPKPKPAKPPLPPPANIPHHNTTSNTPLITSLPASAVDWTVKPSEREKYDKLFDSLQPTNGLIPGNKVKNVLLESKLPFETLGKIWDLADQDKDGMLDRYEFVAAMHLVYKALEKYAIPNTLPPELVPPIKKKTSLTGTTAITTNNTPAPPLLLNRGLDGMKPDVSPPPPAFHPSPVVAAVTAPAAPPVGGKPVRSVQPTLAWVVTPDEKIKSDALFVKSDVDKDGFVSGQEIKDVFLQSGVPQMVLAHIWALCDIKQSGKLNNEQFALAMWFIARCLKGIEPPPALTPEMVPPSFRTNKVTDGLVENNNTRYSNPELDMISKDIEELTREKLALEADIAQKEADLKIKTGEIKNLQSELDTLAATLKQLENQKGEAQKRLNDLRLQWYDNEKALGEVSNEIVDATSGVDKLRTQAAEQAEAVSAQEAELNSKKQQLEGLRQEEQRLERERDESTNKLQNLSMSLQESQLSISQAKALITQLQEQTRQMNDAIQACDAAITTGDVSIVPDTILRIQPDFRDPEYIKIGLVNGNKKNNPHGGADDPFKSNGPTNSTSGFTENLFKNDPFNGFEADDPFNPAFSKTQDGFSSDPFGGVGFGNPETKADPFDAFADSRKSSNAAEEADKDPFGCDPFAVLHAPTRSPSSSGGGTALAASAAPPPRPTSPSPALPPKKSKQPPPRPAPPRPVQPPSGTAKKFNNNDEDEGFGHGTHGDPFGSGGGGAGSFADFTDFDAKLSKPPASTGGSSRHKRVAGSSNSSSSASAANVKGGLDFTDDPFRDYRYEDPFNISFDDDDDDRDQDVKPAVLEKRDTTGDSTKRYFGGSSSSLHSNSSAKFPAATTTEKFDPFGLSSSSTSFSNIATTTTTTQSNNNNNNSSSGRLSVPLSRNSKDPFFANTLGAGASSTVERPVVRTNKSTTPFGSSLYVPRGRGNKNESPLTAAQVVAGVGATGAMTEDDQLAWAARESLKLERERRERQLQEEADLELAITLSKAENNN